MSKTIKQIADELGVSKQAVTKCIDNLGLRATLTKSGNLFLVGDSQEKAIKQAFAAHQTANQNANRNANQSPTDRQPVSTDFSAVIDVLQATIDTLQGQIAIKDEQLSVKDEQIRTLQAQLTAKDDQIGQITAAMESTAAALTAAQALHAADKKTLMLIEDKENERKLSFWERRAAKKAEKKARKEQSE